MAGEPVAPGQYLRISAKDWNEVRARLRNQRAGGDRNEGLKLSLGTVPSCSILVHNSSSSITYPAQGVVGLPNHAIDPAGAPVDNALRPVGLAGLPDGVMPYGIAMIPIPPGQTGYVVVSGVSSANIEVTNIDHEYAVAISGDNTKLTTAESGPIRLLTRFGSTASNAVGLVFVGQIEPVGGGGGAYTVSPDTISVTFTTADTWYTCSDEFELEPGKYHLTADLPWYLRHSGANTSNTHAVTIRLYDVTNAAEVEKRLISPLWVVTDYTEWLGFSAIIDIAYATTFRFEIKRTVGGSPTFVFGGLNSGGKISLHEIL